MLYADFKNGFNTLFFFFITIKLIKVINWSAFLYQNYDLGRHLFF